MAGCGFAVMLLTWRPAHMVVAGEEPAAKLPPPKPGLPDQPGTSLKVYAPKQHGLYDGKYRLSCGKVYMVGGLHDEDGWDHVDNEAKNVRLVDGTIEIDVDEIRNTGKAVGKLKLPEGLFEFTMDRWFESLPCQDGGVASMIFEHGDSGCGNALWPKTLLHIAGWGMADVKLEGKPLYTNYEAHFMVTQGIRDRETLKVNYPIPNRTDIWGRPSQAGEVNPAAIQMDFWIRSPKEQVNQKNNPPHKVFVHGFCMEVTFK
jgi:hypothetical protein